MPQQSQFFMLCLWGLHNSCTTSNNHSSPLLRTVYFHYFDYKIGDQNKSWAQHICCKPCQNGLTAWFNDKKAVFNFAIQMFEESYEDDCHFCLTNIAGLNASCRKKIKYPKQSAMRPVPHSDDLPVPTPSVNKNFLFP